jgi:hypothetical protein
MCLFSLYSKVKPIILVVLHLSSLMISAALRATTRYPSFAACCLCAGGSGASSGCASSAAAGCSVLVQQDAGALEAPVLHALAEERELRVGLDVVAHRGARALEHEAVAQRDAQVLAEHDHEMRHIAQRRRNMTSTCLVRCASNQLTTECSKAV